MTRIWNATGIDAAMSALNAVLAPEKDLGDAATIAAHLDGMERDGETEVSSHLTRSRRPEVVRADPSWFSEECPSSDCPGYAGPCPEGMDYSAWLAFNNID